MTDCERYREQIEDCALGRPLGDLARSHLEACGDCTGALARLRAQAAALDENLTRLLAAEPAPSLRARIAATIQSRSGRSVRSERSDLGEWSFRGWPRIAAAAAAGIVIAVVATTLHSMRPAEQPQHQTSTAIAAAAALSHWRSPTDALLVPSVAVHSQPPSKRGQGAKHAS